MTTDHTGLATPAVEKVENVEHPDRWCEMCGNTGWVELVGSIRQHGIDYSRGTAPCRWCMLGAKRYERATGQPRGKHDHHRPWTPESQFSASDVHGYGPRHVVSGKHHEPLVRELPGLEDAPVKDLEAAARRTYGAWRVALGKELADSKVRAHYPDQAELVILEADALGVPIVPAADEDEKQEPLPDDVVDEEDQPL